MFDLEHDNVKHAHNFLHPCSIGIFLFLIKDVTNPSPRLLLANPREYLARVKRNAGAAQLMMFLLHVGIPVLSWQRMVRGADTAKIPKIRAYAWHLVRQQPPRTHAPPARRGTARLPHTARTPRSTACGAGTPVVPAMGLPIAYPHLRRGSHRHVCLRCVHSSAR